MNLGIQVVFAALLAIPVACVSWTVTQEEIFRDLREAVKAYEKRRPGSLWRAKLAYLPTCSYCFSHYASAVFVCLFRFPMLVDDWRGYLASFLSIVLIANVYLSLYHLARVALRIGRAVADQEEARLAHIRAKTFNKIRAQETGESRPRRARGSTATQP